MKKIYLKLTEDQKRRGVIFSSTLSYTKTDDLYNVLNLHKKTHEVLSTDEDKNETIKRLLNDSFFNRSSYKYNVIRQ